jgi:hypothetical protein
MGIFFGLRVLISYRQAYPTDSATIKQTNKILTNDSKT